MFGGFCLDGGSFGDLGGDNVVFVAADPNVVIARRGVSADGDFGGKR